MSSATVDETRLDPFPTGPEPSPRPRRRGGGPRTPEGKARVRYNAMTHGLRAETLLPADLAIAVEARVADLDALYRPGSEHAAWLVRQVASAEVRLDRCEALQLAALQRRIDRAELAWHDDRRAEAEALGAALERDPARVAATLRTTRHGAEWLRDRWESLARALDHAGGWDLAQRRLALDLLGAPPALRDAHRDLPPDADLDTLRELVAREWSDLDDALRFALVELDEADRAFALDGLDDDDPEIRRLQRYEAKLRRVLAWAIDQLRGLPLAPEPEPELSQFLAPPDLPRPPLPAPPPPRTVPADSRPEAPTLAPVEPAPVEPAPNRRARRQLARLARQAKPERQRPARDSR